jgi:hypothetical protein
MPIKDGITLGVDTGDEPWEEGLTDPLTGRYLTLELHSPRFHQALSAKGTEAFNQLIDQVSRHQDIRRWCGLKYVEGCLIRWLQEAQVGEVPSWGEALLAALRRDVKPRRVLVPVQGLAIEREFLLGSIRFGYFTREYFEEKVFHRMRQAGASEEQLSTIRRKFEQYEGAVYGGLECIAEPQHATELAFVGRGAVSAAHPAALDVRAHCLWRMVPWPMRLFLVEAEAGSDSRLELRRWGRDLDLAHPEVELAIGGSLGKLHRLLQSPQKNDLQRRVLAAMSLFSGGLLFEGIEQRLLHAFFAVESLLLKDPGEPITSSVAARLAHLVGQGLEERRGIVEDFRNAYKVRSDLVHHGELPSPETVDLVNRAVRHCWTAVLVLLDGQSWTTRDELIRALDDRALS